MPRRSKNGSGIKRLWVQPVWLQLLPDRKSLKSCGKPLVLGIRSRPEPLSMGEYSPAKG
jgi:hypothetical protein